eukprot:scaffold551428_cov32-Prasinocladus_malaysianus.AAC.1
MMEIGILELILCMVREDAGLLSPRPGVLHGRPQRLCPALQLPGSAAHRGSSHQSTRPQGRSTATAFLYHAYDIVIEKGKSAAEVISVGRINRTAAGGRGRPVGAPHGARWHHPAGLAWARPTGAVVAGVQPRAGNTSSSSRSLSGFYCQR